MKIKTGTKEGIIHPLAQFVQNIAVANAHNMNQPPGFGNEEFVAIQENAGKELHRAARTPGTT